MQKYMRILLIAFIILLFTKSAFAKNPLPSIDSKDEYKEKYEKIKKILDEDKNLKNDLSSSMKALKKCLNDKMSYERMLEIIKNIREDNLSDYLKHEIIMKSVDEFRGLVKTISNAKNIEENESYTMVIEFFKKNYKDSLMKIIKHYVELAKIHDRLFEEKKGEKTKISIDSESIVLNYVGNSIIDELKVVIPSITDIETPSKLAEHLENAIKQNEKYMETIMKAYTVSLLYEDMYQDQSPKTKKELCSSYENLIMTIIQVYKMGLEIQSRIFAYIEFDDTTKKLLIPSDNELQKVVEGYDERINAIKEELSGANGMIKKIKSDKIEWLQHEKNKKIKSITKISESRSEKKNKHNYKESYDQMEENRIRIKNSLMQFYWQINEVAGTDAPNSEFINSFVRYQTDFAHFCYIMSTRRLITND
jgi:hypothetical protein